MHCLLTNYIDMPIIMINEMKILVKINVNILGGEVGLARQCIKSIVSGNNHLLLKNEIRIQDKSPQPQDHSNPQSEKQTRFSDTFLPGRSSCQVSFVL